MASRITFTTSLFLPPRLHFYALIVLQLHATREQRGGCQGHQGSEAAVHGPLIGVDRLCSLLGIQPLGIRARGRRRMRRRGGGSLNGGGRSRNSTHTRCEAAAWCPQHILTGFWLRAVMGRWPAPSGWSATGRLAAARGSPSDVYGFCFPVLSLSQQTTKLITTKTPLFSSYGRAIWVWAIHKRPLVNPTAPGSPF